MKRHSIALIAGDGIGREVVPAARRVLEACASHQSTVLGSIHASGSVAVAMDS